MRNEGERNRRSNPQSLLARVAGGQALRPVDIVDGKPYYGPPPLLDAQPDLRTWSRNASQRVDAWLKEQRR